MLNLLRRGVKTWVAKALFGLLVVSFAIWGIGDVFSFGIGSSVATVGDQKISAERYANTLDREIRTVSQRFGQQLDADAVRALGLPQQVLARMAQEATLDQVLADLQVSAPDSAVRDAIVADPGFRGQSGAFDHDTYRYVLAQNGYSVDGYEETVRRAIVRRELIRALSAGAAAPKGAIDAIYTFQTETRRLDHITLDESFAGDIGAPDDAALEAYHAAHPEEFSEPERRSAVYLDLSLDVLSAGYEPDEDELRELYEHQAADFARPERRRLFQIVFDTEAEANAAASRVAAGEIDFDGILAEQGESRADTALGDVTEAEVASAAGAAAFAPDAPGVVGPVDTGFGFALIDVAEIFPAETTSFEAAKDQLAARLRRDYALDHAPELAGEVEDRRAAGATLEEIAAELSLPLVKADGVAADGDGASGLSASPEFLAELFTAEEGEERDLVETAAGGYFVLRVDAITPAALQPLSDVRDAVAASWRAEAVRNALSALGETIVERANGGEPLSAIAAEMQAELKSEGPKSRGQGWNAIPAPLVTRLFELPPGGADFEQVGSSVVIASVADIAPGAETSQNIALREALTRQMNEMAANDVVGLFIAAAQQEVGLSVDQQAVEAMQSQVTGFGSGH
ncbi:peptidylprolyl isomerase [Pikeienuella sp. HZG-20]|uniref:peptidylprolyl isomerase n=1 Tax=Paludibacillus litoralis TaxID=3133267 RepID=UPI0030ED26B9